MSRKTVEERYQRLGTVLNKVALEYQNARAKFSPFNSFHEGYAVLLEEVDELWDEIKKKRSDRNIDDIHNEAIQIAAMAIALILDEPEERKD